MKNKLKKIIGKFTDAEKSLILALYEMGATNQQVAETLHTTSPTLAHHLKINHLSFTKKKSIANRKVEASLYRQSLNGNTTAMIFWLCNRSPERWQSLQKVEQKHTGSLKIIHSYGNAKNTKSPA